MREEEPEDLSVRKRHKSCQTEITSENEDLPPFQKHILLRFSNLIDELRAHRNKEHKARKKKKRRTYTEFEDENADNDEDDVLGGKEEEDILRLNTPNHTSLHEHDDNHDENGTKNHNHIFSSKNYSTLIQLLSKFQRANMQMNQPPLYGDQSFPTSQEPLHLTTLPLGGGGGGGGDGDFPEFHQHHLSVNTQTPMDFLNNSFHSAIIRSADPDLLFPSGNESLRHHSAPSVRPSPVPNSVGSLSEGTISSSSASGIDHPEFIHYPTNNDTAISGPVISPHDGCPYPNGPLYGGEAAASGLPPYPQLNHSYAVPPQQQQRLPPAFIKQEIKTDLPSESNNNSNNINNNNELKRTLDHGFRNSTLVKTEKDAYSSSSSTSSSSSSSFKNSSNSSFSSAFRSRYSKDEKRARDIGVPFSVEDIVSLPMDEYNDMIARHALTDDQLSLCRDIRRRGKNKVAAQNCRKRKIHQITELKTTIDLNREIQNRLIEQRSHLIRIREEFSDDGSSVAVVPKISTTTREDVSDTNYRH
ncbi:unnamed protein product [Lepeophtheirus salmonis]|uniref:(salmon louse) hypothetical protein n=1 Tax=Lepeophtheirus salmonis TaxID=72036 RepID=A0A7R8CI20_LEPSM|nr:unnamed protein product [Lepeophtheirus salmonis]CAF2773989.1 unnamed protein product [Lepeophtheirus salmonis]